MKKIIVSLPLCFVVATVAQAQTNLEDQILGTWPNPDKDGKIEIYKTGN
ncbi:hypothetical protein G7092_26485 [Mucilaginibacter sp. HC2]|nr:hypothetical protein [Mucilaginibacter inviolabilis]NHA07375.1 hypothetical protein [Mucilaginibacter inviolabilis]